MIARPFVWPASEFPHRPPPPRGQVMPAVCALRLLETSPARSSDNVHVFCAWVEAEKRALGRLAAAKPRHGAEMLAKAGEAVRRLYASIENGTQDAEVELGLAVLRDMRLDRLGVPS